MPGVGYCADTVFQDVYPPPALGRVFACVPHVFFLDRELFGAEGKLGRGSETAADVPRGQEESRAVVMP